MRKILLVLFFCFFGYYHSGAQNLNITAGADSFYSCGSSVPALLGAWFEYNYSGFAPSDLLTATIFWGDGTFNTYSYTVSSINGPNQRHRFSDWHEYLNYGVYDLTFIISGPGGVSDTLVNTADIVLSQNCINVHCIYYEDVNSNCVKDPGESALPIPAITVLQGLTKYVEYGAWNTGGTYVEMTPGYFYSIQLASPGGYAFTCPASGISNIYAWGDTTIYFAAQCQQNVFDHRISNFLCAVRPLNSALMVIAPSNPFCFIQNGSYTLTLDPDLSYITANPVPASVAGNVITWQHTGLNTNQHSITSVYVNPSSTLAIGDSVCNTSDIQLQVGDVNPANNTSIHCAPVTNSYDPNDKFVYPQGNGPSGIVPQLTEFTYLITFQNTGNDTAYNVSVLDTLSSDLDYNSFRLLNYSHNCKIYFPSDNVALFRFNNIYLPDSGANEMLSHGFLLYSIKAKQGLTNGTQIRNTAHIYFDHNAPVVTSTTLNTISGTVSVTETDSKTIQISPNPASSEVVIASGITGPYFLSLYDINGKLVQRLELNVADYKLDVSKLPAGIYSGTLLNNEKHKTFRLVVQH